LKTYNSWLTLLRDFHRRNVCGWMRISHCDVEGLQLVLALWEGHGSDGWGAIQKFIIFTIDLKRTTSISSCDSRGKVSCPAVFFAVHWNWKSNLRNTVDCAIWIHWIQAEEGISTTGNTANLKRIFYFLSAVQRTDRFPSITSCWRQYRSLHQHPSLHERSSLLPGRAKPLAELRWATFQWKIIQRLIGSKYSQYSPGIRSGSGWDAPIISLCHSRDSLRTWEWPRINEWRLFLTLRRR